MGRVKTFTNGGSLLPGDLNSIQDDYELAFSGYKHLATGAGSGNFSGTAAFLLWFNGPSLVATASSGAAALYLDPADFAAGSRAVKYRVKATVITNAVAPANTTTVGLYPVATWGGASGAAPFVNTVGAVVAGSTAAVATPALSTRTEADSGDFAAPAAGYYVLGFASSGSLAAFSFVQVKSTLFVRQV